MIWVWSLIGSSWPRAAVRACHFSALVAKEVYMSMSAKSHTPRRGGQFWLRPQTQGLARKPEVRAGVVG